MATESVHSVSDPVPIPTQPYTTEEPGPLTMANAIVNGDSNEVLNLNDDEIQLFIESNDNKNTSGCVGAGSVALQGVDGLRLQLQLCVHQYEYLVEHQVQ
jgi:hypothetical protein